MVGAAGKGQPRPWTKAWPYRPTVAGGLALPSSPVQPVDPRLAITFGQRRSSDVFEQESIATRRRQRGGECLAGVHHARRRHRLDARGFGDAGTEIVVAADD